MNKIDKIFSRITIMVGVGIGGIIVGNYAAKSTLVGINPAGDLNRDGIEDMVLVYGAGHKIPLYGVKNETTREYFYLSASKMKEKDPNSIVDYDGIEERLNPD